MANGAEAKIKFFFGGSGVHGCCRPHFCWESRSGVDITCLDRQQHPPRGWIFSTNYRLSHSPKNHPRPSPGGGTRIRVPMLASVRTSTRTATTLRLRSLAIRRVDSNSSLTCLPRCSFRQLSSSRVWRSQPGPSFGTSAAAWVTYPHFLGKVWLTFTNDMQTTKGHRPSQKHSPSKQTTDSTHRRSTGHIPTVNQSFGQPPSRNKRLILIPTRHVQERYPTLKIFAEDKPGLPNGINVWSPGVSYRLHRYRAPNLTRQDPNPRKLIL